MTEHSANTVKAWYLIQCKARQDARAEENLSRQGFLCFRPMYGGESSSAEKAKGVGESLFPGYLFVQLGAQDNWSVLRSTRGVLRVVSFGGKPTAVECELVEQLRQRPFVAQEQSVPLVSGETVRIEEGPFASFDAVFLEMDGEARVVLLLTFLQRQQKIYMPLTGIRKI
ncbi:transcription/translation regulatory transformer protein RfaH [Pseudomonas sp. NY15364]|uniref:transcription/translation regulatory transformer protein RfaH n=1 Tax=Pseudomonas sp. NY15364 TaxID=3400353 RepID=UPI003A85F4D8